MEIGQHRKVGTKSFSIAAWSPASTKLKHSDPEVAYIGILKEKGFNDE